MSPRRSSRSRLRALPTNSPATRTMPKTKRRPARRLAVRGFSAPFLRQARGMPETGREFVGLGSGFIVDPQGYIVTNNHVVSKAEKITVILQDNSRHEAKVIGRDEKTDLALIKIDAKEKLPVRHLGRQRSGQGRRLGRRGRQSVRARRHGDRRHRFGGRAQHQRGAVRRVHPDRRADQPRQLRRPHLQSRRRGDRGQHRDLLALGRLGRDRLRGSLERREERRPAAQGKRPCHARLAGRRDPGDHAGDRQEPGAQFRPAERRAGRLGDRRTARRPRPGSSRATSSPRPAGIRSSRSATCRGSWRRRRRDSSSI